MSHGHSHHTEEHPEVKASSALYAVLILAGLVIGLIGFVQSMSASDHHDDSHGSEHHTSISHSDHSWDHASKPLEFSSNAIMGLKEVSPVAEVAPATGTTAQSEPPAAADSTTNDTPTQQ